MGAIAADRAPERCAPVGPAELVGPVAVVPRGHPAGGVERRLREPGHQPVVAQEQEGRAREFVAARLRDHVHGPAARTAGLRGEPARDHLELLYGLLRHQRASAFPREPAAPEPEEGALGVRSVDREAGVHAALAAQGEPAPVGVHLHGGLEQSEPDEIAPRDRERRDLLLVHVAGRSRPPHLQDGSAGVHRHRFLDRGETEPQVQLDALADVQMEVFPVQRPESVKGGDEVVLAAGDGPQREEPAVVRYHRPAVAAPRSTSSTVTPGSAAPVSSVTKPWTEESDCARRAPRGR